MKNLKLSHSAVTKYQSCGQAYKYHYVERLRPKTSSGPMLFGTAIDLAIQQLLKPKGIADKKAEQVFEENWITAKINDVDTYLPTCTDIVYANSDADVDLITVDDDFALQQYASDWKQEIKNINKKKDAIGFKYLKKEEKTLLNHYNWLCLFQKGLLMLDTVRKQILPNITEVLAVQAEISLENDNGDGVTGFADLVCRYKGIDKPVILDFKTSAIEYEDSSVKTSPQLALYVHALSSKYENTDMAGYIVLHKRIQKNKVKICSKCGHDGTGKRHDTCNNMKPGDGLNGVVRCDGEWTITQTPECTYQVIIDKITPHAQNLVVENIDAVNVAIKSNVFVRNFQSCIEKWGKCSFYEKCHSNSDEGLVKKE